PYNVSGSNFQGALRDASRGNILISEPSRTAVLAERNDCMISSQSPTAAYSSKTAFPAEAHDVLRRLRRAIAEMFDNVPGGICKSRDVQKLFGVSTKLSWQIFKLAGPGDALSLAPHVPKEAAMRRVLDGAQKFGVPTGLITEVRDAYSAFEELIQTHAGDRT